jgi:PAB-dependent poly(A)-specific ribonuclease subunit 3
MSVDARLLIVLDSQLPTLDNFHTLVALDTSHHKSAAVFGFPGWVYKATSSKNGKMYCLRRLEGKNASLYDALR